jgi:hypothetical protein
MLGVFLSPHYAVDHFVYLTYAEPGVAVKEAGRRKSGLMPRMISMT